MNLETINRTYDELTAMLRELGLEWVVHQVDETVSSGSQVEKTTSIFKDEGPEEIPVGLSEERHAPRRRGKPAQMMSVQPWSDAQQLEMLIDAIRHALVYAAEIEEAASRQIGDFSPVKVIRFESDQESPARTPLVLSTEHRDLTNRLMSLLNSLEAEIKA